MKKPSKLQNKLHLFDIGFGPLGTSWSLLSNCLCFDFWFPPFPLLLVLKSFAFEESEKRVAWEGRTDDENDGDEGVVVELTERMKWKAINRRKRWWNLMEIARIDDVEGKEEMSFNLFAMQEFEKPTPPIGHRRSTRKKLWFEDIKATKPKDR